MTQPLPIFSPFEQTLTDNAPIINNNNIFEQLLVNSKVLDNNANNLLEEVDEILNLQQNFIDKNLTFKVLFNSIKQLILEYQNNCELFNTYTQAYDEINDEENIVKVLDILREILNERKTTVNEIINNLIKIQKLTNERIKIDMSQVDDDIDDIINPDEI